MKRRFARGITAFLCIAAALPATMARADYQFTTIDPPGAEGGAYPNGINNAGQVVGLAFDADFNSVGFLYSGGNFSFLSVPESDLQGINNKGEIAGSYSDANFISYSFLLAGGSLIPLDPPGAVNGSAANGVNDLGMVVGTVFGANAFTGYLLSGGVYSAIAVPGAGNTSPLGINNSGDVVGITSTKGVASGFLLSGGDYTLIKVPGTAHTFAFGINSLGTIVGSFQVGDVLTGYVLSDGVFTTVRVPGAVSTEVYGINDSGMIVGAYYGDDGIAHAYLGTPVPEPSSALLAGVAFPLIAAWARRRRPGRDA
jgi:probable HAF family extracellular repeat protein